MRPRPTLLLAAALLVGVPLFLLSAAPGGAAAPPAAPVHTLVVMGLGVGSYPAFDPAIERYAVTTTPGTGGTLTVQAATSDPAGVVRVDGRIAPGGAASVTGLADGDEVSVLIEDSAGVEVHSFVYLPAGFPALEATQTSSALASGVVGLTLNPIFSAGPRWATTVDRNGVPTHVRVSPDAFDLKDQPNGHLTVQEPTTTPGRTGYSLVELDAQWRVVAQHETDGLVNTDQHDSILLPDGTSYLMSYEHDGNGELDSVFQELDSTGHETFRWSSDGLQAESMVPEPSGTWDYAHMNSMVLADDGTGDIIASFRHLSAVLRIATRDHGSYQAGDIVWRLGGRASDFDFVDDPYDGPCAQHTASLLPNGHLLVFDDGSDPGWSGPMCVDPSDPGGPAITRVQSRVAEYELDLVNGTATLVWSYQPSGWYTWFMGSAARLANGNTLVGWAANTEALAQEVDSAGQLLWQVRVADPKPVPTPISYRASLMVERDAEPPVVDQVSVAEGATYVVDQSVPVDFRCTDRGGSSLQTCGGDLRPGGSLDTSTPGAHTLRLTARDGDGLTTTVTRSYTVAVAHQPRWGEDRVRSSLRGERVSARVTLVNAGAYADQFALEGSRGNPQLDVRYKVGGKDVTEAVRSGRFRTRSLNPGESFVLRVVVSRTDLTRATAHRRFRVRATSVAEPGRSAETSVVVRAR